ncbi:hypothetical protein [Leptolyngbya sp. FACHB-261]|uniref:hypothetical protein n=1 Tax=Leptolyngbya sp. FACHB-261 TaxID=2692806 RepID=UPI001683B7C3|nr:hypothetical protein [Leptolyngbya sp. FACHB-261]MBD2102643.1 hypothetical protein [Leptolyngbya sp. FACHB-261]
MAFSLKWAAIMSQAALISCVLSLPALAGQTWAGSGQITSGSGQGGSVELRLEVDGKRVRSRSGPPLEGQVQPESATASATGLNGSVRTGSGTWRFEQSGNELRVTLYQGNQIIYYRLRPQ